MIKDGKILLGKAQDQEIFMIPSQMNRHGLIDKRYEEVQYLFFSLSGYSKWVEENADSEKVKLITLEQMYNANRNYP